LVTHTEVETAEPAEPVLAAPAADPIPDAEPAPEEIRLHRPLIRASLPRVATDQVARPIPEFTIRQASRQGRFQNPRAARFAGGGGGGRNGGANMNNQGNTRGAAPHGARQGGRPQGQGNGAPGRPGQGRPAGQHQNSHKKRSR
jgi:translation initiation factor IF-2